MKSVKFGLKYRKHGICLKQTVAVLISEGPFLVMKGFANTVAARKLKDRPESAACTLAPDHSLMHWIRYCDTAEDLAGTGGKVLNVTAYDMALHSTEDSAWMILNGRVFNVTPYLSYHPGGVEKLMLAAGKDGTDLFNAVRLEPGLRYGEAQELAGDVDHSIVELCFGDNEIDVFMTKRQSFLTLWTPPRLLHVIEDLSVENGRVYRMARIESIRQLTCDTKRYELEYCDDETVTNIPVGSHVFLKASLNGAEVCRPYTPVSLDLTSLENKRWMRRTCIIMKIYQNGTFTTYFDRLKEGDFTELSFPCVPKSFHLDVFQRVSSVYLFAAGSGITPLIDLILFCLQETPLMLMYFNKSKNHIILFDWLQSLSEQYTGRLKIYHVLSQPDTDWTGLSGLATVDLVRSSLSPFDHCSQSCVCGSDAFADSIARYCYVAFITKFHQLVLKGVSSISHTPVYKYIFIFNR
ncbi:unnamed protein product [Soboliphyme baturini]|uniref:Cytochrome-b5 reductase n=1 Tax=Soboliphyme baturini TaxID=241478 RepID=A0A183IF54_9BILA|nr:unnamed protein product [Soboliphyme baturini]